MENKELRMKQLLKVIDCLYNDYIGCNENSMLDGEEYHAFTLDELIETITNDIITCETYLPMEGTMEVVEAKHFRFIGKDDIKSIVTGRCFARKKSEGKWQWEKVIA